LPGRIWQDVAPVWIPDVTGDANFPRAEIASRCGLHAAFGFPVRLGPDIFGAVEFFSRKIRQPDAELLEMFAGIGAQIGQFIERRRAEAELRALNVELEQRVDTRTRQLAEANVRLQTALENEQEVGRLKSSFVSLVSHEFRTPLGVILSSSEILHRYFASLEEPERHEHLDAIKSAVLRMSGLMEEVLFFSRVEADKLECLPAPLDLAELCQHLRDEACSATSDRCPIDWNPENNLAGAHGDEELLRHIISNLLSNAVKYSAEGSPIDFSARREGRNAIIQIIDRGVGIPADAMPQLFTAFFRGSNVSGRPGTGLGLSIVKKCVDLHGGEISLDSTEGVGTTVRLRLPLYR
jgi:signal transduction histidine kinase